MRRSQPAATWELTGFKPPPPEAPMPAVPHSLKSTPNGQGGTVLTTKETAALVPKIIG